MKPNAKTNRFQFVSGAVMFGFVALVPGNPGAQEQPIVVETQRLIAQEVAGDTYFGTVRASDIASLSYGVRGCVLEVSEAAKRDRVVTAGEVLVNLDDQRAILALRTAEARVSELAAAIEERELAVSAAIADDRRREEELDFVSEEFQRSSVMLGRGLINESTMDTIERRFMDAKFTAERAKEAIINAKAAVRRAEIAHEIGKLDLQSAEINLGEFVLTAPFDGVVVGFDANVGDCVQEGEAAARLYEPNKKSVDVFFPISRLSAPDAAGLSIGSTVKVTRINKDTCEGTITQLDSEADPETQFVEATVVVEEGCAPNLFLNEGVEIEAEQGASTAMFTVPSDAVNDSAVFLIDENSQTAVLTPVEVISQRSQFAVISLSGGDGRLMVSAVPDGLTDGAAVSLQDPS